MKLNFRSDLDEMFAGLSAKVKARLPIGIAIAMSQTAGEVWAAEQDAMNATFDRPTPYTLKSVRYSKATPQKLEAEVWLDDEFRGSSAHPAAEYLIPQIDGGVRAQKRSEYILQQAGIMPAGMAIVPSPSLQLDAYGNISTGLIQRILSALRVSESVAGHTSNRPIGPLNTRQKRAIARAGEFFVASKDSPHGRHLHPGIYQRIPTGIFALLLFVPTPQYEGRLDFAGVADETTERVFEDNLREQLAITMERAA